MYKLNILLTAYFVTLLLISCIAAPVREWPAMEGQVLDAESGEPIEGAITVVFWEGYGGHGTEICFHVEAVTTDKQGIFLIPEWGNMNKSTARLTYQYRHVPLIYKNDYKWSDRNYREQSQRKGIYYLDKSLEPANRRLNYLSKLTQNTGCGKSDRNLYALFMSMHGEAATIASTVKERALAKDIKYRAEKLLDSTDYSRPIQIQNRALPAQDRDKSEPTR